jgi:hypothetical protein
LLASSTPSGETILVVTSVHAFQSPNIGDMSCGPASYFAFPFPLERQPFIRSNRIFDCVILGGGGLFHAADLLQSMLARTKGLVISWGLGNNDHNRTDLAWPEFMGRFALHGIRDWNSGFNWVPCVSCMHPFFDESSRAECEAVVFAHQHHPIKFPRLPTMSNGGRELLPVLRFLAQGEVVITNSYHGAYWATLLGKRVVVANPFSTRFLHSRYPPAILRDENWRAIAQGAPTYPGALAECRAANRTHFESVCALLG